MTNHTRKKHSTLVVLSLFDGISCGFEAIKRCGFPEQRVKYIASEIDSTAIRVAKQRHPTILHVGDITRLTYKNGELWSDTCHHRGRIHLILAGSPCQGLSTNGRRLLLDDPRSALYNEFLRLLNEVQPDHFLLENVSMPKHIEMKISNDLRPFGAELLKINSNTVCAQNRLRLYWTNINQKFNMPRNVSRTRKFHITYKYPMTIKALVGGKYSGLYCRPHGFYKGGFRENADKTPCITKSGWLGSFFVCENGRKRKFTPSECEILQTLPVGYTIAAGSDSARVALIGNAWTVDIICGLITHAVKR